MCAAKTRLSPKSNSNSVNKASPSLSLQNPNHSTHQPSLPVFIMPGSGNSQSLVVSESNENSGMYNSKFGGRHSAAMPAFSLTSPLQKGDPNYMHNNGGSPLLLNVQEPCNAKPPLRTDVSGFEGNSSASQNVLPLQLLDNALCTDILDEHALKYIFSSGGSSSVAMSQRNTHATGSMSASGSGRNGTYGATARAQSVATVLEQSIARNGLPLWIPNTPNSYAGSSSVLYIPLPGVGQDYGAAAATSASRMRSLKDGDLAPQIIVPSTGLTPGNSGVSPRLSSSFSHSDKGVSPTKSETSACSNQRMLQGRSPGRPRGGGECTTPQMGSAFLLPGTTTKPRRVVFDVRDAKEEKCRSPKAMPKQTTRRKFSVREASNTLKWFMAGLLAISFFFLFVLA